MIELAICGFQSGADQAGARSAKAHGIQTGGWMPRGWLTEDGPRPDFATLYNAWEHPSPLYPPRTYANVRDSTITLLFGNDSSHGSRLTIKACREIGRPIYQIANRSHFFTPTTMAEMYEAKVWNIAGNRESASPGIGAWVESWLDVVFRQVASHGRP